MFVEDVEWVKNNIKSYNDPSSRTMPANRYEVINVGILTIDSAVIDIIIFPLKISVKFYKNNSLILE